MNEDFLKQSNMEKEEMIMIPKRLLFELSLLSSEMEHSPENLMMIAHKVVLEVFSSDDTLDTTVRELVQEKEGIAIALLYEMFSEAVNNVNFDTNAIANMGFLS